MLTLLVPNNCYTGSRNNEDYDTALFKFKFTEQRMVSKASYKLLKQAILMTSDKTNYKLPTH